jgi:multidrug efflux pump subunit AcrB
VEGIRINQLAARNLTLTDVENALRSENIELPAGNVESRTRDFLVRIQRGYRTVADFENLVLTRSADGYLVRLLDVALVETGPAERRNMLRGNGVPMVGIGIVKQSKASTLAVAKVAKAEAAAINKDLPEGMRILQSYNSSVFIESAIDGVYMTLFEAVGLVVLVIYLILSTTSENPNMIDVDHDYKETKPQLQVVIDRNRAGDLGVSIEAISRTLESKLGSRRVTTFIEDGEEYDVLVEGEEKMYRLFHFSARPGRGVSRPGRAAGSGHGGQALFRVPCRLHGLSHQGCNGIPCCSSGVQPGHAGLYPIVSLESLFRWMAFFTK